MNVAGKFNGGIPRMLFLQGFHIARSLRMISTADDQLGAGQGRFDDLESLNHEFKPFVSSPFAKGEDAMPGIAASSEIGVFRPARQNPMGSHVNVVVAILFLEDLPITGHQHGDRIGEEKHSCSHGARRAIQARMLNSSILQIDGVHQVMQSYVGIAPTQTDQ